MKLHKFYTHLVAAGAGALLLAGCSKKEEAPAADASPAEAPATAAAGGGSEVLPGASDVRKALAEKNYQQAVGGLIALNQMTATEQQRSEWGALFGEVRETLLEQSNTDAKAAEALMQLRAIRAGR